MSGGFFPAPEAIIAALGPAQAVLYGRIWRYCQGGGTCYASIATLAGECGIGESTAKRWIAALCDGGWIVHVSGKTTGRTGRITTTRKWIMGGGASDVVDQSELPGRSERATGVGQNDPRLIRLEDKSQDRIASPSSAKPKAKGATREPRPLFDAFKGLFPAASNPSAGKFERECIRLGYTYEHWRGFIADGYNSDQIRRGFITRGNLFDRFATWVMSQSRKPAARVQAPRPSGAPDHWRDLIYTHDGTRKAPALILPALGLDRYAPPDQWPEWLRLLESEGVMV